MSQLFPDAIETKRLRLEALRPETVDVLAFYEICAHDPDMEEVTRYMPWEPHSTPNETLEFVEKVAEMYEKNEGGSYLIYPQPGEDGAEEIAGDAGFTVDWDRQTLTTGLWLRKRYWGRGYSGERAAAMMTLAFDRLDLECYAVDVLVENDKSRRAIETFVEAHGGQRDGRLRNWVVDDGERCDVYRYSVTREEWDSNHDPDAEIVFHD